LFKARERADSLGFLVISGAFMFPCFLKYGIDTGADVDSLLVFLVFGLDALQISDLEPIPDELIDGLLIFRDREVNAQSLGDRFPDPRLILRL